MAAEKSIFLNTESLFNFLKIYYHLENVQIFKTDKGSANCYKIQSGQGTFFLKEFQSRFTPETVEKEIQVCETVKKAGIPTSEFVKNKDGNYVSVIGKHCFHLQKWIDGDTQERNTFDEPLLMDCAEVLGKIHQSLEKTVLLAEKFPKKWFLDFSVEKAVQDHRTVKELMAYSVLSDEMKEEIRHACDWKIHMLQDCHEDFLPYQNLTKVNSHGDFHSLQILCEKNPPAIKAVIDFSSSARVFAPWEIFHSYVTGAKECLYGQDIHVETLKRYIDRYLLQHTLSLFDVGHMAGFYYFTLLRSTYGFVGSDEKTAEFALWRTALCRYLKDNYQEIDLYLYHAYQGRLKE